jgi:hypothetical protein
MDINTLGVIGFAFAAAALATIAHERRLDVLHGPYIQGRSGIRAGVSVRRFWTPAVDRLRWKARNVIYLAAIVCC